MCVLVSLLVMQDPILSFFYLHLVIMILRVYALYGRSFYVLSFLLVFWVAQIIISFIGISTGFREYMVEYVNVH